MSFVHLFLDMLFCFSLAFPPTLLHCINARSQRNESLSRLRAQIYEYRKRFHLNNKPTKYFGQLLCLFLLIYNKDEDGAVL